MIELTMKIKVQIGDDYSADLAIRPIHDKIDEKENPFTFEQLAMHLEGTIGDMTLHPSQIQQQMREASSSSMSRIPATREVVSEVEISFVGILP